MKNIRLKHNPIIVERADLLAALHNAINAAQTDNIRENAGRILAWGATATLVAVGQFDLYDRVEGEVVEVCACPQKGAGVYRPDEGQPADWGFIAAFDDAFQVGGVLVVV